MDDSCPMTFDLVAIGDFSYNGKAVSRKLSFSLCDIIILCMNKILSVGRGENDACVGD